MNGVAEAVLTDGRRVPYVLAENPPRGGMKHTYFSPDRSCVVQFYNDPETAADPNTRKRLEAIVGKYNPTLPEEEGGAKGNTEGTAAYFARTFCWPRGIVQSPEFGILCPAYPENFFFGEDASSVLDLKGRDKKSNWFTTRNRRFLSAAERGDFRSMLGIGILLARSVRRMHQAGLAHSDLSCNNVLIDPPSGSCIVIDIDSLVVPGVFPPEVAGTRGYIAPEVYGTLDLPFDDPRRKLPCAATDLHALAVLLYEYLLLRHPLTGPRVHAGSAEEDDFLALGREALFIEDPGDTSNRPDGLEVTIGDLGPILSGLFLRAFVDGLHNPEARPAAMEWERGLARTWDLLQPCENPDCPARWFVLHDPARPVCPFCGRPVPPGDILRLRLMARRRGCAGQWLETGEVNLYHNMPLCQWHVLANAFPDEKTDRRRLAYICKHQGQWLLMNEGLRGMTSPGGRPVPAGQAIQLQDGALFRLSDDPDGLLAEVCGGG